MTNALSLILNGVAVDLDGSVSDEPLVWIIRDKLGLKGTKFGCGHGGCGACTMHLAGCAVTSCNTLGKDAAGKKVAARFGQGAGSGGYPRVAR